MSNPGRITWNPTKAKEKKEAQAKSARRDIATLLERGKLETARVKVENIINEDIYVELLELLELHCELVIARFGLLDQPVKDPDPRVLESICSIIYAAPRTELKELNVLREMLMYKYGREFSLGVMENRDNCVSERVMKKLTLSAPSPELVDAYLFEIAKGYGVTWSPPMPLVKEGGNDGEPREAETDAKVDEKKEKEGVLDNVKAKVEADVKVPKLPDMPPTEGSEPKTKEEEPVDEFEALAKRFEALKKR
ncbi:DUF292-domain-containing protein [Thelephora ganbajun]|uniref:DUF292-domain-containing protein n=1 Tax=Thelephora ganbajun TaxID=370292 RepID=A0ACB6ZWZ4_THEGA|nr:DUF292-domain-containing protein [Thelephora ganbajun]